MAQRSWQHPHLLLLDDCRFAERNKSCVVSNPISSAPSNDTRRKRLPRVPLQLLITTRCAEADIQSSAGLGSILLPTQRTRRQHRLAQKKPTYYPHALTLCNVQQRNAPSSSSDCPFPRQTGFYFQTTGTRYDARGAMAMSNERRRPNHLSL